MPCQWGPVALGAVGRAGWIAPGLARARRVEGARLVAEVGWSAGACGVEVARTFGVALAEMGRVAHRDLIWVPHRELIWVSHRGVIWVALRELIWVAHRGLIGKVASG